MAKCVEFDPHLSTLDRFDGHALAGVRIRVRVMMRAHLDRLDGHALLAGGLVVVGPELRVGLLAGAVEVVDEARLVAGARGVDVDVHGLPKGGGRSRGRGGGVEELGCRGEGIGFGGEGKGRVSQ
eukprot:5824081-Prymnesium_polylepis.1